MKIFKLFVPLVFLLLSGCATQLPSFAHVHVGHTLSAWPVTPNQQGLFALSEKLAVDVVETAIAASELSKQGEFGAATQAGGRIATIIGSPEDEVNTPDQFTFLAAFEQGVNHFRYSIESDDATNNLQQGLGDIVSKSPQIIARSNVIKELATLLGTLDDEETIAEAIQQLRVMAVQNLDGGDGNYSLRDMRNDLAATLDREDPPYIAPGKKFLFGLVRAPTGKWFWNFENADGKNSYGRYAY
ncbi:MAG: hypothetical protein ACI9YO_003314 [Gammaproteobacteria bacterium]|jgi:hypothetical protein